MPGELIPIVMFVSFAAVLIFRPLTKKLGSVLEHHAAQKRETDSPDFDRVARLMEDLVNRLDRLEERVDFTERMLESGARERQSLLSAMKDVGVRQERKSRERS